MVFKFVVLACALACANAGLSSYSTVSHGQTLSHAAPLAYHSAPVAYHSAPVAVKKVLYAEEQHAPAQYEFAYAVHDEHTGDIKEQKESRQGDVVHGMYSLIEADGSKRIVEYTADDHSGFNAVVHREAGSHPVHVKAVAAPIVKTYAAPVLKSYSHAAPVYSHAAPVYNQASVYNHAPVYNHAAPLVKAHYSDASAVSYAHLSTPTHAIHH